jgi:hypothetical protein
MALTAAAGAALSAGVLYLTGFAPGAPDPTATPEGAAPPAG